MCGDTTARPDSRSTWPGSKAGNLLGRLIGTACHLQCIRARRSAQHVAGRRYSLAADKAWRLLVGKLYRKRDASLNDSHRPSLSHGFATGTA